MRKIKLTDRITYVHFEEPDEEGGNHGLLMLEPRYGFPMKSQCVTDQDEFKFWYSRFIKTEEDQKSRAVLSRSKYAL